MISEAIGYALTTLRDELTQQIDAAIGAVQLEPGGPYDATAVQPETLLRRWHQWWYRMPDDSPPQELRIATAAYLAARDAAK